MFDWLKKENEFFAWVPTLMWGTLILVFSVLPYRMLPSITVGYFDKMAHFFEYTILAVLIGRGLYSTGKEFSTKNILLTLILGGVYGILMELVQRFIPGRDASPGDIAANMAGIVFGILIGKLVLWQK
jgi:VanZ family protein